MGDIKMTPADQLLEKLVYACLDDLTSLSPADTAAEFGAPQKDAVAFDAILVKAKAESGSRRLMSAKRAVASRAMAVLEPAVDIDIAVARQFLADAANDARFTLAARELGELPNEEIIRLYRQALELKARKENDSS
jgi:glycerol-3-phosphate dehydrogenase